MCQLNPEKNSEQDDLLLKVFNQEELKSIDQLINAFDSMIIAETKEGDINAKYQSYFYRNDTSDMRSIEVDFNKPENLLKFREAIQELKSKKLFSDFWRVREYVRWTIDKETHDQNSDSLNELDLNPDGRFMQILKTLQERNEVFENYYTSLRIENGISPGMIARIMKADYKEMDFNYKVNRLVWTVHYITVLTQIDPKIYEELNGAE